VQRLVQDERRSEPRVLAVCGGKARTAEIVNTERIREIQPLFNGTHSVLLYDGTRLTWSRGYREQLRALTGEET
jgi:hypothetical protein